MINVKIELMMWCSRFILDPGAKFIKNWLTINALNAVYYYTIVMWLMWKEILSAFKDLCEEENVAAKS